MWAAIGAIISWFLELIGAKQSAKQVQSQNVGESDAEQGLEKAQNEQEKLDNQAAADTAKLNADANSGSLRDEVADVNNVIDRKPSTGR